MVINKTSPSLLNAAIGAVMGVAIGDALALPCSHDASQQQQLPLPIRDFAPPQGIVSLSLPISGLGETETGDPLTTGQWSSVTQLTLAMAETLYEEGGAFIPEAWAHKLVAWLNTEPRLPDDANLEAAFGLRGGDLLWDEAGVPYAEDGNAAIRTIPLAILYSASRRTGLPFVRMQTQVTHASLNAFAASLAIYETVLLLLEGCDMSQNLLERLAERLRDEGDMSQMAGILQSLGIIKRMLEEAEHPLAVVNMLGVTDYSLEAIPCALYLALKYHYDAEEAILQATNLTQNRLITALVGALVGVYYGASALPNRWRREVEDPSRLITAAVHLVNCANASIICEQNRSN